MKITKGVHKLVKPKLSRMLDRFIKQHNLDVMIMLIELSNNKATDWQIYHVLALLNIHKINKFFDGNKNYITFINEHGDKKAFVSWNQSRKDFEINM